MKRSSVLLSWTGVFFLLLMAGCGGGGPKLKGKVLLDSQPLADAVLTFQGKEGGGFGVTTDANGEFEMTPNSPGGQSVKPGEYRVSISKVVDPKGKALKPEDLGQIQASGKAKQLVPAKYSDPAQTTLTATIKGGDNNLPPFDLKSR